MPKIMSIISDFENFKLASNFSENNNVYLSQKKFLFIVLKVLTSAQDNSKVNLFPKCGLLWSGKNDISVCFGQLSEGFSSSVGCFFMQPSGLQGTAVEPKDRALNQR